MHIYVFQPFHKGEKKIRGFFFCFPGLMKLPVCLSSIVELTLEGWALPEGRYFFLQELSPIESGSKVENGRIVSLKT